MLSSDLIIKEIEKATDKTVAVTSFLNKYSYKELQVTLSNEKSLSALLWDNLNVIICIFKVWIESSEEIKEKWRQKARLIFKAMPKDLDKIPDIIEQCHKENICGIPAKRKYDLFESKNSNKEENERSKKFKTNNVEKVLQNLSLNKKN